MNIFENETLVERVEGWIEKLLRVVEYSLIEVRSIENFVVFLVIINFKIGFGSSNLVGNTFDPIFLRFRGNFRKPSREIQFGYTKFSNSPIFQWFMKFAQIISRDISENGNTIRIFIIKKKKLGQKYFICFVSESNPIDNLYCLAEK